MKIVSNELKIALKQPTTQRKGRILVNGNYYEVYNVEYYADAYNEGNVIGNAIASQLDFDLPYMDKFETFKYYDGVWTGAEYEYVDMGTFTVFDEQDEDEFNKHITAFDNLIKFNKQFEDVGGYPKTLYQELENICSQAEVELQNASIPNGNFIVENNQFVEGENLKTVLKAIEQISGTYGIIKNDNLVLQLKNQTTEEITKNEHEPITWKRRSYGINQVILGMEDVQGEYVLRQDDEDIAINGVHKLVINDNPFVYTQQKREEVIDELFNQVKGFGYVPYDLKMEWLNYMDIGDTITIDGVETLILRMYGKSPKSLESEISAPAIIDSAIEYSNNTFSLSKRVSRTEFGVDKNAREIQAIVETTETIEKEINPTKDESGSEIVIEDGSNRPLNYLEIEGKSEQSGTPTPDTPIEIESVGYENLFDKDNYNLIYGYFLTNVIVSQDSNNIIYIPIKENTTYTVSKALSFRFQVGYTTTTPQIGTEVLGNISNWSGTSITITTGSNAKYLVVYLRNSNVSGELSLATILDSLMITKGAKQHSYVPYSKYGIEVETVGKNLFDSEKITENLWINATGDTGSSTTTNTSDYIKVEKNKKYCFSYNYETLLSENARGVSLYDENKNVITGGFNYLPTSKSFTITPSQNGYIRFSFDKNASNMQFEEGAVTKYQPYQKITKLLELNTPLRSLPNGIKDIAYIKNNELYVDRYVGSIVLNGSEEWLHYTITTNAYQHYLPISDLKHYADEISTMSTYFVGDFIDNRFNKNNIVYTYTNGISFRDDRFGNSTDWKTWLSTHNTQVDYELAEPYTEELGEIETLTTLKGYNKITTTDDLQPTLSITYVRDTVLADYVENHVTELKLNEEQIRQSVETVSSSVDGLTTEISRVEQITTDNSQVLNIISTNIDKSTGEVREVTTTTGFTFNAEGSSIKDSDGFEVLQTPKGAYYKDNGTITGQYTKDGSKQKDLELFGTYSYGKTDIDDTPMFVGQLYTDENGEETFGHFYNGGDY